MFWLVIFILTSVFTVYQLASEKTLSRPIWLLLLGAFVCIWAASLGSFLEFLEAAPSKFSTNGLKTAINVCSLSLGALGGGLISSAFFQRARILHFSGIESLETIKFYLIKETKILEAWLDEIKDDKDKKETSRKLRIEIFQNEREIKKIEREIEKRRPAA